MTAAVNVCEHGDHPAPDGKRFCSQACADCELADCDAETNCAGLCAYSIAVTIDPPRLRALCLRAHDARDNSEAFALARADLTAALSPVQILALVERWEDVEALFDSTRRIFGG